jgi:hypothetical protein
MPQSWSKIVQQSPLENPSPVLVNHTQQREFMLLNTIKVPQTLTLEILNAIRETVRRMGLETTRNGQDFIKELERILAEPKLGPFQFDKFCQKKKAIWAEEMEKEQKKKRGKRFYERTINVVDAEQRRKHNASRIDEIYERKAGGQDLFVSNGEIIFDDGRTATMFTVMEF